MAHIEVCVHNRQYRCQYSIKILAPIVMFLIINMNKEKRYYIF